MNCPVSGQCYHLYHLKNTKKLKKHEQLSGVFGGEGVGGYKMELLARNGFGFNTINKKKNEKMY